MSRCRPSHAALLNGEQSGQRGALWLDRKNLQNNSLELPKNAYTTDLFTDYGSKYIDQAIAVNGKKKAR